MEVALLLACMVCSTHPHLEHTVNEQPAALITLFDLMGGLRRAEVIRDSSVCCHCEGDAFFVSTKRKEM